MESLNELKKVVNSREKVRGLYGKLEDHSEVEYYDEEGRKVAEAKYIDSKNEDAMDGTSKVEKIKYYDENGNLVYGKSKTLMVYDTTIMGPGCKMKIQDYTNYYNEKINIEHYRSFGGGEFTDSIIIEFFDKVQDGKEQEDYLYNSPEARELFDLVEKETGYKIDKETLHAEFLFWKDQVRASVEGSVHYDKAEGNMYELTLNGNRGLNRMLDFVSEAKDLFENLSVERIENIDDTLTETVERIYPTLNIGGKDMDAKRRQLEDLQTKLDIATTAIPVVEVEDPEEKARQEKYDYYAEQYEDLY